MVTNRAFDEIVDFLTSCPKPEDVITFKPSATAQSRVSELLVKKQEDRLSEPEQKELDQFMMAEHMMRLAKARARKRLAA